MDEYSSCTLCPRTCSVDRMSGEKGYCREGGDLRLSYAGIHYGEEPSLTGTGGSGTLFFPGCTLRCRFCQNVQISHHGSGSIISVDNLAEIMLSLQTQGAWNINLISATQFIPSITRGITMAKENGLVLPLVWNTSGYETAESIDALDPLVDMYLPDLKTLDPDLADTYFHRADYPGIAMQAIRRMTEQKTPGFRDDRMTSGVIVRHLVLPGHVPQTEEVLRWLDRELGPGILFSLMFQYLPPAGVPGSLSGRVTEDEYRTVMGILDSCSNLDGFVQEIDPDSTWYPDFTRENPFPPGRSIPVWNYSAVNPGR